MENTAQEITGNSNSNFRDLISKRFQDMFSKTLIYLEVAFPHQKGDGSENEKRFNSIRSQILRIGNDNIRELDNVLNSFVIFQLYEYKQILNKNAQMDIFNFKNKYKILGGKGNGNREDNRG